MLNKTHLTKQDVMELMRHATIKLPSFCAPCAIDATNVHADVLLLFSLLDKIGMPHHHFAHRAGISRSYLSQIKTGRSRPKKKTRTKLIATAEEWLAEIEAEGSNF